MKCLTNKIAQFKQWILSIVMVRNGLILFNGRINFFSHWQENPKFKLNYWRWKTCNGTFEFGVILFGRWFTCLLDFDFLMDKNCK